MEYILRSSWNHGMEYILRSSSPDNNPCLDSWEQMLLEGVELFLSRHCPRRWFDWHLHLSYQKIVRPARSHWHRPHWSTSPFHPSLQLKLNNAPCFWQQSTDEGTYWWEWAELLTASDFVLADDVQWLTLCAAPERSIHNETRKEFSSGGGDTLRVEMFSSRFDGTRTKWRTISASMPAAQGGKSRNALRSAWTDGAARTALIVNLRRATSKATRRSSKNSCKWQNDIFLSKCSVRTFSLFVLFALSRTV